MSVGLALDSASYWGAEKETDEDDPSGDRGGKAKTTADLLDFVPRDTCPKERARPAQEGK